MSSLLQRPTKPRVIIIGAGKIGAFFDHPGNQAILTHAHAFSINPYFELVGFVDSNRSAADEAAKRWGGSSFVTTAEAFYSNRIDVAVVSTPNDSHFDILMDLAQREVRFVLCEKPLTKSLEQAEQITTTFEERQIPLGVNYTRRFVPEFQALHRRIIGGEFGNFLSGIGLYGKGITHNGSHLIDLVRYLLGEVAETNTLSRLHDLDADDPSCSAYLSLERGGNLFLGHVDHRQYTIFELDLIFEKGRVRMLDSGLIIEEYVVGSSPHFEGYKTLKQPIRYSTSFSQALGYVASGIQEVLETSSTFQCMAREALRTLTLCSAIKEGRL